MHTKCWLKGLTDRGNLRYVDVGRRTIINWKIIIFRGLTRYSLALSRTLFPCCVFTLQPLLYFILILPSVSLLLYFCFGISVSFSYESSYLSLGHRYPLFLFCFILSSFTVLFHFIVSILFLFKFVHLCCRLYMNYLFHNRGKTSFLKKW